MHGSGETEASGSRQVAIYKRRFPKAHDDEAGKRTEIKTPPPII